MGEISKVSYEDGVVVERLRAGDISDSVARAYLELKRDAYAGQLEPRTLPRGTMRDFTVRRIADLAYERGILTTDTRHGDVRLWVVRDGSGFASAVKTRPAGDGSGLYIIDILTQPKRWRKGLGSHVLHAALTGGGQPKSSLLSLHAFVGSGVNKWYERLGFKPQSEFNEVWYTKDHRVLTQRYRTRRPHTLGYVASQLAAGLSPVRRFN